MMAAQFRDVKNCPAIAARVQNKVDDVFRICSVTLYLSLHFSKSSHYQGPV